MRVIQDKVFANETVNLDDTRFMRCKFQHCTMVWSGRKSLVDGSFSPDCAFVFTGVAARVLGLLQSLGMVKPVYEITASGTIQ